MLRLRAVWALGGVLATAMVVAAASAPAAVAGCDRGCLMTALDRYIDRAAAQDFTALALSKGAETRENTLATRPDAGVWKTLKRVRAGYRFADPVTGNAVFAGVFERRDGGLTPLLLRIRLKNRVVVESEIAWNTTPGRYFHPEELLYPDILYEAVVPAARRSTRAELIRIAGLYLDGIGAHSSAGVPLGYRCDKYYLGGKVTNNGPDGVGSCLTSFDGVRAGSPVGRRFPIVDVERGIVVVSFLMPNAYKDRPDATYECEILKVVDGRIRSFEEFGNSSAWPPDSGFKQ